MLSCQGLERFDLLGDPTTAPLALPRPADESVDEKGGRDHAVVRGESLAILIGDEAGAICVGEDQVVEFGQEARRSRDVRVGHRGVGHIEEFFSALVTEDTEARPEPLDHLAESGQARPDLYILDGGRTESTEVTQHNILDRRGWV